MERSPRPRKIERRAEQGAMRESVKRILVGLFTLTTTACDPFGYEDQGYRRGVYDGTYEAGVAAKKAAQENSPEALEAKAQEKFKAKLVELEQAGYSVEISGVNLSVEASTGLSGEEINELTNFTYMLRDVGIKTVDDAPDPLTTLEAQLKLNVTDVAVPIYQMHIIPSATGTTIKIDNWLTDKTIYTDTPKKQDFSGETFEQWQARSQTVTEKLQQAIQKDKLHLADTYGKLLTDHGISINAMDIMQIHAGDGMEQIAELFNDQDIYRVTFNGFKRDTRVKSSPYIKWELTSDESQELLTTGTPEINGTLTNVELVRNDNDSATHTIPDWWNNHVPNQVFQDKYGNTVMVESTSTKHPAINDAPEYTTYYQTINISVPTAYLNSAVNEADWTGWNVDLTKIGLPELKDFAYNHPEKPVAVEKTGIFDYSVYFEGDDALTTQNNILDSYYFYAAEGAKDIQVAFYGYDKDQQIVHNIVIEPDADQNGSFTPRNSATIALTAGEVTVMHRFNPNEVTQIARHESGHAMFNHLTLEKDKTLTELHKRLSPAFFHAINEENWLEKGFGGHGQDNETEFFATFIDGLMVDGMEARMHAKLTPALAAEYADAAKTVRLALEKPLHQQNGSYETIEILQKLKQAETIANAIAAGK